MRSITWRRRRPNRAWLFWKLLMLGGGEELPDGGGCAASGDTVGGLVQLDGVVEGPLPPLAGTGWLGSSPTT